MDIPYRPTLYIHEVPTNCFWCFEIEIQLKVKTASKPKRRPYPHLHGELVDAILVPKRKPSARTYMLRWLRDMVYG